MAAPLLQLRDIRLTFGGAPLLDGAEFVVGAGERLALVGRNGSGKSTLLKIAAGLAEADSGERFADPAATIRYLPQEPDLSGFETALAYVEAGLAEGEGAAVALQPQHAVVGNPDQGLEVFAVFGEDGPADRGGRGRAPGAGLANVDRGADRFRHPPHPLAVGAGRDHRELVAADPRQGVGGAQHRVGAGGRLDQDRVADLVAVAVIDPLEVVEVDQQHRQRRGVVFAAAGAGATARVVTSYPIMTGGTPVITGPTCVPSGGGAVQNYTSTTPVGVCATCFTWSNTLGMTGASTSNTIGYTPAGTANAIVHTGVVPSLGLQNEILPAGSVIGRLPDATG